MDRSDSGVLGAFSGKGAAGAGLVSPPMPERLPDWPEAKPVSITINGRGLQVPRGITVLEAARLAGIKIPTLCHHPSVADEGACRVCVVEVEGAKSLVASCVYPVQEGMKIKTNSPLVREARKMVVELLLGRHPQNCPTCPRGGQCELISLARDLGVNEADSALKPLDLPKDETSPSIVRDPSKCVLCGRCVRVCDEIQGVAAIGQTFRGTNTVVAPAFNHGLGEISCVSCGQCANVCPVGALYERDAIEDVQAALADPDKYVVVQVAPAVRASLGEEFGMPPGSLVTGKMVTALKMLGFDRVFDTQFTADLTIMEEVTELLERLADGGPLPLLTSCSPGWVRYCEHFFPEFLPNVSTCKSPEGMMGALIKTYFSEIQKVPADKIYSVSVMPCTAKKMEADRPEINSSGLKDVDAVLTTRELGRLIREAGIDFLSLSESRFDAPLGASTGAATIFGTTGGVMEAALRTAYELVTGIELGAVEFSIVRGFEGVREASVTLDGEEVRVAICHGLKNAARLLEAIKSGSKAYHFVEIMCCPSGCVGGGGQPRSSDVDAPKKRAEALYREDRGKRLRKSHQNPTIQWIYQHYLERPGSGKSHELLHTHYTARERY
jgi:iron-only hydrogenase group A